MNLHLSDLDELVQNVRNTYSKRYLNEAVIAYRAGAYRAAVISTWIAVCVDVIEKVKELSISNDSTAKIIEDKLDAIKPTDVNGMMNFEKEILKYACDDLGLISHIEKRHLDRLKDDRNICAHPTLSRDGNQFSPLPELARTYIVQAATYLLVQTPIRGKVVVDDIFRLINEESFPESDEQAFEYLSSERYLGRVKDGSVRSLLIILLKRLFKDETSIGPQYVNRYAAAVGAINRLYPEIAKSVFSEKLPQLLAEANDSLLKRLLPLAARRSEIWNYVEHSINIRVTGLIESMESKDIIKYRIALLADKIPSVYTALIGRVESDDFKDLSEILKSAPSKTLLSKAIDIFAESRTFDSAYRNGMDCLVPCAHYMSDDDLSRLFKSVKENNQILRARGIGEVFSVLYEKTKLDVHNHAQLWSEFVEDLKADDHHYSALNNMLIQDGILVEPDETIETSD